MVPNVPVVFPLLVAHAGMGTAGVVALLSGFLLGFGGFLLWMARRRPRSDVAPPAPLATADERYAVVGQIGSGGHGAVYLARDTVLGREVVLKRLGAGALAGSARDALVREARAAARVSHPNLVQIFDVTRLGDDDVLVMEYVRGGTLADRIARGPVQPAIALRLIAGILEGLRALHAAGVVHRDVKPANVLLTPELVPKISDMGVARIDDTPGLSAPGVQPGTVRYMSPEQARGDAVDGRADLYAAAAVLYEMLTARHYLGAVPTTEYGLRQAIVERPPALPVAALPPAINGLLARGLEKDPTRRFQSAQEFLGALRERARAQ